MAVTNGSPLSGPKRLGDRLLEAGLITRTQLDLALERQETARETRQRLGRTLVDLGFVHDHDLVQLLAIHFGIPAATSLADPDGRALAALPATVACHYRALPFQLVHGTLRVAIADAPTPILLERLQRTSTHPVRVYVASDVELDAAVTKHYGGAQTVFPARLRELAVRLLQLAEEARVAAPDDGLRAELARTRADIDALVTLLAP
jgi:type IV pilus assembly protein PilB